MTLGPDADIRSLLRHVIQPMPTDAKIHEPLSTPTLSEQVLASCTLAREHIEVGNYDTGYGVLKQWWTINEWPNHVGLEDSAAAELLFTAGVLSGWIVSTGEAEGGQKGAEGLLNGAITLFERLGAERRAAEGRIELACCYYRQGLFDLARKTVRSSFKDILSVDSELRSIALIRLAIIETHTGHPHDALSLLNEAAPLVKTLGQWIKGRFHLELATTLKNVGIASGETANFDRAMCHYQKALKHFESMGNHRYAAMVENNHGYLLSTLKRFDEAQPHLGRARTIFDEFGDLVRRAQVDETLAQLYLASERYDLSEASIKLAVDALETSGEDALLAEALSTQGLVLCRLGRRYEAKPGLERARRLAERCGDHEGAGKSLLILIEEMCEQLGDDERREIGAHASQLLANSQQAATRERLQKCLDRIATAHAEYEQQRERAAHAEKMAALGELSFGVAHNVNNMLTGILGRAQLLLRNADEEKTAKGLELIIKSAEDGAHIIKRIQDFARERPSREFQAVPVAELLKEVCEITRPRWESRAPGAEIRCSLHADSASVVMGDPVELREVLVNMIYNAVDALPGRGEIRLGAHETNDRVQITVTDNGSGMPAEVKSRLFNPFFTTKGKAGTGMGLAVSFGIVRRHNGSIEVDSEVGRGTTFRISLPLAHAAASNAAQQGSYTGTGATGSATIRLLVVDDEAMVRELLADTLRAEGCEVLVAENGHEALEIFDRYEGEFDAVFTDIGMPEMNGWELATAIRRRSENIALAIVSGWADAIGCDSRNAVKADWVVSKPFDVNRIAEIANEIAERKRLSAFPAMQKVNTSERRQRA